MNELFQFSIETREFRCDNPCSYFDTLNAESFDRRLSLCLAAIILQSTDYVAAIGSDFTLAVTGFDGTDGRLDRVLVIDAFVSFRRFAPHSDELVGDCTPKIAATPLTISCFVFVGLFSNLLFSDIALNVILSSVDGDVDSVTVGWKRLELAGLRTISARRNRLLRWSRRLHRSLLDSFVKVNECQVVSDRRFRIVLVAWNRFRVF